MHLKLFQEMGLIKKMENGAIYMTDIQEYIGKSSTEADRKRRYREQMKLEEEYPEEFPKIYQVMRDKCPDNSPPETE